MAPYWPRCAKNIINNASRFWFLVFCLTDLQTVLLAAKSSELIMSVKAGETCDMKHDVLLVEDSSSENSYLQCRPAGRGLGGFWESVNCQPGQKFVFTDQRCETNPFYKPKSLPMMPNIELVTTTATTAVTKDTTEDASTDESTTASTTDGEQTDSSTRTTKVSFNEDFTTPVSAFAPFTITNRALSINGDKVEAISPGTSCKDRNVKCGGGSYCNPDNEVCSCPPDTADEGGTCVHVKISAALNERCDRHTKCTGWSVCLNNVCRCQSPLVQNGLQCLPPDAESPKLQAKPGQHCDKGQICIGGSICSTATMLCTCPVGSQDVGDSCMQLTGFGAVKTSVGQICTSNLDCAVGAFCSPTTTPPTCMCLSTHVTVSSACWKIINPGVKGCDYDEQCSASYSGAKCSLGTCICPIGYSAQSNTCKPISLNPGQLCDNNEACFGGATCFHNVCVCPLGFIAHGANCVPSEANSNNINEEPYSNETETLCFNKTACIDVIRVCPKGTLYIEGKCFPMPSVQKESESLIYPLEKYLESFTLNITQVENPPPLQFDNCQYKRCDLNEYCINGKCECMNDFIRINKTCQIKYLAIGQPCLKSQACNGGAQCLLGTCTCLSGLENKNGNCIAIAESKIGCPSGTILVGENCETIAQEDIVTENYCSDVRQCGRGFLCLNNICSCPTGTSKKFGQCWRNPGGNCTYGEVCDGCSICIQNKCSCPGNAIPLNGVCPTNIAKPHETCASGECCISGSECMQGICMCPTGTILNNQECSSPAGRRLPLESCHIGELCIGGATCFNGKCICGKNQVVLANECRDVINPEPSPGEHCSETISQKCSGGSLCNGNVCVCPNGQTSVEKQCIPSIPGIPGDLCSETYPCIKGLICINGVCQCPAHQSWKIDKCVNNGNSVKPGGVCTQTENCSGNAICINHRCLCTSSQVLINGECLDRFVRLNLACQKLQECLGNSQCLQGFCLCPANSVPVGEICIKAFPEPGQPCAYNFSQCTGGSYCNSNLCLCPINQKALNGFCNGDNTLVLPGRYCHNDINKCMGGSLCINNICTCNSEELEINHACKPKLLLPNTQCHPLQQCTGGSQCIDGICLCPAELIVSSFGICTALLPAPGEYCDNNFSICTGGSSCINFLCTCPHNYISISGECKNSVTIIDQKVNDFCDSNNQCTGGAICINSKCVCPKGTVPFENICQSIVKKPTSNCISSDQCNNGAICISGFCTCPAGTLQANNSCLIIPAPGQSCDSRLPICTGGATCINFVCTCPLLNRPINGKCNVAKPGEVCNPESYECLDWSECSVHNRCECLEKRILLNSKCINPDIQPGGICSVNDICSGGSVCIDGICQCPSGFVQGPNYRCILPDNPLPGQKCTSFQICSGNSICTNGFCQCQGNMSPINGMCPLLSQSVEPGQLCNSGQSCLGGSTCIKGICVCPPNQVAKGAICEILSQNNVAPGGNCFNNFHCGGGSNCVNGKCSCPVNFLVYSNQCIPRSIKAGDSCVLFVQICTGGSRCLGSLCSCPQNYIVSHGRCIVQKSYFSNSAMPSLFTYDQQFYQPEEQCITSQTCHGGSICVNNVCKCPDGFSRIQNNCIKYIQQNTEKRTPGTWCTTNSQCGGKSKCVLSVCVCEPKHTVISGKCSPIKLTNFSSPSSCLTTDSCIDGLTCVNGVCQCLNDMTCEGLGHFSSPPGGSCAALQRCSGGSMCRSGWCVCPEASMVVTNGYCLPSSSNTMFPKSGQTNSAGKVLETVDEGVDEEEASGADESLNISELETPLESINKETSQVNENLQQPVSINSNGQGTKLNNNQITLLASKNITKSNEKATIFGSSSIGIPNLNNSNMFGQNQYIFTNPSNVVQQPILPPKQMLNNSVQPKLILTDLTSYVDLQQQINNPQNPSAFIQPPQIYNTSSTVLAPGSLIIGAPSSNSFISPPLPAGVAVMNPPPSNPYSTNFNNIGFQGKRQYAKPGGPCDLATICTGGSKCILSMCLCEDQFEVVGPVCVRKVPPASPSPPMGSCQNGEACTGGAICDGQVCQCMPGTELVNNICQQLRQAQGIPQMITRNQQYAIVVVPPLSTCGNGERCGGNSMCNRATLVCECPADTQPIHGHCLQLLNKNRLPNQQQQQKTASADSSKETPAMPLPVASAWTSLGAMNLASNGGELYPKQYAVSEAVDKTSSSADITSFTPPINTNYYNYNNNNIGQFLPAVNFMNRHISPFSTNVYGGQSADDAENEEPPQVPAPPNRICGRGKVCTGGSFCVHFKCRCPEGSSVNEFDICQSSLSNGAPTEVLLGRLCDERTTCVGSALCISGRCRCPPETMQDGPVCISLKDSGKTRYIGASIFHADATSVCPNGVEPVKNSISGEYIQCDASRPSGCPWGWYCYATAKALEDGPYYCCPSS